MITVLHCLFVVRLRLSLRAFSTSPLPCKEVLTNSARAENLQRSTSEFSSDFPASLRWELWRFGSSLVGISNCLFLGIFRSPESTLATHICITGSCAVSPWLSTWARVWRCRCGDHTGAPCPRCRRTRRSACPAGTGIPRTSGCSSAASPVYKTQSPGHRGNEATAIPYVIRTLTYFFRIQSQ